MSLSKKSKWILGILILLIFCAYGGYKYAYKPHKTIEEKKVDYTGSAVNFISQVSKEPKKWTNKVVVLEGVLTAKETQGITLNNQIFCQLKESIKIPLNNQTLKIKGRVIGYDDLLEEIKLDQSIIIK